MSQGIRCWPGKWWPGSLGGVFPWFSRHFGLACCWLWPTVQIWHVLPADTRRKADRVPRLLVDARKSVGSGKNRRVLQRAFRRGLSRERIAERRADGTARMLDSLTACSIFGNQLRQWLLWLMTHPFLVVRRTIHCTFDFGTHNHPRNSIWTTSIRGIFTHLWKTNRILNRSLQSSIQMTTHTKVLNS